MKAQFSKPDPRRERRRLDEVRKPQERGDRRRFRSAQSASIDFSVFLERTPVSSAARHRKPKKNAKMDLRRDYKTTLMFGLALSLSISIWLFRSDIRASGESTDLALGQQELVQMEEIQQTQQIEKPPPPPRPPVPVEVPDDTILDDDVLDLDATLDMDEAIFYIPLPPPPATQDEELPEPEIFVVVEEMPQIIGGPQKVYEYLRYPPIARQAGMEGLVVIQIVVNEEGIPQSPEAIRSAGEVLDNAAIKAVMQLRFIPGRQRGRPVKVRLAIPIRFRFRDVREGRSFD